MIRLIHHCWTFFLWGVGLLAVVAVILGAYFVVHLDDEIRHEVQRLLASHYDHLDVRVEEARLIEGKGIELRNLSFRRRNVGSDASPLLEVEEVFLACPVQIKELIRRQGLLPLQRIVLHRPHLKAARLADGSWDVGELLPLPHAGEKPVEVVVKKGLVELACDPGSSTDEPSSQISFRELTGVVRPTERLPASPDAANDTPTDDTRAFRFAASATGPLCKQIQLSGLFSTQAGLRVSGTLGGLSLTGRDLAALPGDIAEAADGLRELRGTLLLEAVELRLPAAAGAAPQFKAHFQCEKVELEHDALPDPITNLSGEFLADRNGLHASKLAGECGTAHFSGSLRRNGWAKGSPFSLSGHVENLLLQRRHWMMTPESIRLIWDRYEPEGRIDLTIHQIAFDGTHLIPHVQIACRDVSLLADKVPYRLRRVHGNVAVGPAPDAPGEFALLDVKLAGEAAGERQITIVAAYRFATGHSALRPEVHPVGSVRVTGQRVLVEKDLLAAMPDGPRRFLTDLRPQGEFDFVWQASRSDPAVAEPSKQLEITLQGGAVNYTRFPYPLQDVRGKIYSSNGDWDFVNLTATAGGGTITCKGSLRAPADGRAAEVLAGGTDTARLAERDADYPILRLNFAAEQIALDSSLYAALPAGAQRSWDALAPAGRVDVTVGYHQLLGGGAPQIEHWIVPYEQTVSIRPRFFPYRIEGLQGRVHLAGTDVRFHDMSGRHGRTQVVADGSFRHHATGAWTLELNDLSVDRLIFEKELISALPPSLQRLVTRLDPRGQISIDRSNVRLSRPSPTGPVESAWQLNFDFHQVELDCGVPLKNMSGGVSLAGHGQGETFSTDGEVTFDSVRWNKFFFHDVRGPLYADASRVVFGRGATEGTGRAPNMDVRAPNKEVGSRQITAAAYGGTVRGDGVVTLGNRSQFALSASYEGGDLQRLVAETWATQDNMKGTIYGRINVKGMSQSPETITGDGVVALHQAELYQLPQLIRLFKLLRRREPDKTAFTEANAAFRIFGKRVYFDKLNLSGDALTLYGRGSVVLGEYEQPLYLTFDSDLTSPTAPLAGLRSFMRQASNQFARTRVQGTIANPRIELEPLPVLNEGLQQIQQGLDPQARRAPTEGWPGDARGARSWLGPLFR